MTRQRVPGSLSGAAGEPREGDVLAGKYELGALIGSGGMGRVFRGRHLELDTPVAVKVMHGPPPSQDPERLRRFRREARAAALLRHPNVLRVFDFGQAGGTFFIVMELIEGVTLTRWLHEAPTLPSLLEVKEVTLGVTEALVEAHEHGVVHRDLKPDNVLITPNSRGRRRVKVVDFGLAHLEERDPEGTLTRRDAVAGTPAYMSPEQCRSLQVGPSTDLYSLGCMLTELLQGRPPFVASSPVDVISQQLFAPPPGLERPPGSEPVPPLLERLRLDLLAKLPHQRPASAEDALRRLVLAFDPAEGRRALPDRKGNVPLGARGARSPSWTSAADARTPKLGPNVSGERGRLSCSLLALESAVGLDAHTRAGLGAHGIEIREIAGVQALAGDVQLVLVDAGDDLAGALDALASLRQSHPDLPVVIAVCGIDAGALGRLIEAGAADVARYPLSADRLGPKLGRAARGPRA